MTPLWQLAKLIRSKNAGPFILTFDILFESRKAYQRVVQSGVISPELFARLYGSDPDAIRLFHHEAALAIKASVPRRCSAGDPLDSDIFGGQQHAPLVDIEVP